MNIVTELSATKTGFDLIKSAVELLKRETVDVHEVQARLIELQGLMLDARNALVDADEENRKLKREIDQYEERRHLEEDMEFQIDGGFYVRRSEASKGLIAYCPVCWKDRQKTIPMETSATAGWFRCAIDSTVCRTAKCREAEDQMWRDMGSGRRRRY